SIVFLKRDKIRLILGLFITWSGESSSKKESICFHFSLPTNTPKDNCSRTGFLYFRFFFRLSYFNSNSVLACIWYAGKFCPMNSSHAACTDQMKPSSLFHGFSSPTKCRILG